MKRSILISTAIILCTGLLLLGTVSAVVTEDGSDSGGNYIIIGASDVDDNATIWVDGEKLGGCSWSSNAANCSEKIKYDLGSMKSVKIRFVLTNSVYNGPCLTEPCGKYSGYFYIENSHGETEWSENIYCHKKDCPDGNTAGVKFDQTVTYTKD